MVCMFEHSKAIKVKSQDKNMAEWKSQMLDDDSESSAMYYILI